MKRWIGLMSGTSLDGLDIVCTTFSPEHPTSKFVIHCATTCPYPKKLEDKLRKANTLPAEELCKLDKDFAQVMAEMVNQFITENNIDRKEIVGIASHGHTVFHQPEKGFTLQIGCGQTLAMQTGLSVVNDFRTKDVLAGGQGAPLVPMGEKHLFDKEIDGFINLGGFCNITHKSHGEWKAFDIGPCNLPLNAMAQKLNMAYDKGGKIAASGKLNKELLKQLNELSYYQSAPPKSLGTEWLNSTFNPLLETDLPTKDLLNTITEHIAFIIGNTGNQLELSNILFTGGGALNDYLMQRIGHYFNGEILIPEREIIEYKEALIFAFLGYRRFRGETTTLASVTGASSDQISGVLHPFNK